MNKGEAYIWFSGGVQFYDSEVIGNDMYICGSLGEEKEFEELWEEKYGVEAVKKRVERGKIERKNEAESREVLRICREKMICAKPKRVKRCEKVAVGEVDRLPYCEEHFRQITHMNYYERGYEKRTNYKFRELEGGILKN